MGKVKLQNNVNMSMLLHFVVDFTFHQEVCNTFMSDQTWSSSLKMDEETGKKNSERLTTYLAKQYRVMVLARVMCSILRESKKIH